MYVVQQLQLVFEGDSSSRLCDGSMFRDDLPYTECVLKELLRWRPLVPLGSSDSCFWLVWPATDYIRYTAAHSSLVDDVYRGVVIPAGALVIANTWCVTEQHL